MVAVRHIYFQVLAPILILPPYSRGGEYDAQDIIWVLATYWKSVDINRIPEEDMENCVAANGAHNAPEPMTHQNLYVAAIARGTTYRIEHGGFPFSVVHYPSGLRHTSSHRHSGYHRLYKHSRGKRRLTCRDMPKPVKTKAATNAGNGGAMASRPGRTSRADPCIPTRTRVHQVVHREVEQRTSRGIRMRQASHEVESRTGSLKPVRTGVEL